MLLHTIKSEWQTIRSAIATADWPTTTGSYNPAGTVTHRLVSRMLNVGSVALPVIDVSKNVSINALELRAHFNDNAGTATMCIFAARKGELTVKRVASIALTAGTQTNEDTRYFATTAVVTSYWGKDMDVSDVETGTGIATIMFDTCGYDRFWIGFSAIKASDNVTVEYSGY
jgi:hypothetical protein